MKKSWEKPIENLDIDNFYFQKKKNIWFNKFKNCNYEKVKCLLCQKCIEKTSLTNRRKRYHISVVESKDNDIDNDNTVDNDIDNNDITRNDINDNNVNRLLIVGVGNSGKTDLVMNKNLSSECVIPDRQIKFLTRSPNQYPDYETSDEISSIVEYKGCIVFFDDVLDHKQNETYPFFTQSRHERIDVYYLSQRCFELLLLFRDKSNIIILFEQTAKAFQKLFKDIAGFDMSYEEFKDLCREALKENIAVSRLTD